MGNRGIVRRGGNDFPRIRLDRIAAMHRLKAAQYDLSMTLKSADPDRSVRSAIQNPDAGDIEKTVDVHWTFAQFQPRKTAGKEWK